MTPWVRALAAKCDHLRLTPCTPVMKGENRLLKIVLRLLYPACISPTR